MTESVVQERAQLPAPARMLQLPERLGLDLADAPRVIPGSSPGTGARGLKAHRG